MNQRFDIYRNIHMGVRALMMDTLSAVGRMDAEDEDERAPVLAQARFLLAFCRIHLEKENRFVHPAMESRAPGSTGTITADHEHHVRAFADLEADVAAVEAAPAGARAETAFLLYRKLALFVGENFVHMHAEETGNNEILWRTHCDREIVAIEQAIIAAVPAEMKGPVLRWMLPALSPQTRAQLFRLMAPTMPPEAVKGILAMLKAHLRETDWEKLNAALELPAAA
ncbi:MAG TPA: hemerythrin domain-containing protein [Rhizomicrobium sp.]|nr:hemerythrin domain-containing protein [Rhizomicrobium sp.]